MNESMSLAISTLLDPERLSGALGEARAASRVRIKPGVSVSASLVDADGVPAGWARILWPAARPKADKTARKARSLGLPTRIRPLPFDLRIQWGGVESDPALMTHIARAAAAGSVDPATWSILRHNPLRRIVARSGGTIVRIRTHSRRVDTALGRYLQEAIPVPERLDDAADPHVCVLSDVGGCDLSTPRGSAEQVLSWNEEAGGLFARLHASAPPLHVRAALAAPAPSTPDTLRVHAAIIGALDADLGARIEALARVAPEAPGGAGAIIHADASPDQVLVSGSGRLLLADFDRARMGNAALDVASYTAATGPDAASAFLRGYEQAGGCIPDEVTMAAALLHARALSLADPLREARPDWALRVGQSLDLMEENTHGTH